MLRLIFLGFFLAIAGVLVHQSPLLAQSPHVEVMEAANQLYESGSYADAVQAYQQLVDQGIESSELFYNLGNAYFKLDDVGRAILNYRRAAELDSTDSDILANLEVARAQTIDRFASEEKPFIAWITGFTRSLVSLNQVATLTLFLWIALALLVGPFLQFESESLRQRIRYSSIAVLFLLVIGVLSMLGYRYSGSDEQDAVVTSDVVTVFSGPGRDYPAKFDLHSGAEASLIITRSQWARVALPGGELQGWIPANAIERVSLTN